MPVVQETLWESDGFVLQVCWAVRSGKSGFSWGGRWRFWRICGWRRRSKLSLSLTPGEDSTHTTTQHYNPQRATDTESGIFLDFTASYSSCVSLKQNGFGRTSTVSIRDWWWLRALDSPTYLCLMTYLTEKWGLAEHLSCFSIKSV